MGLQGTRSRHQLQTRAHGALGVVLVSLGIAEIDQNTVAHVLRYKPPEALHRLSDAFLISRNDLAEIFGGPCGPTVPLSRQGRRTSPSPDGVPPDPQDR